MSAANFCQTLKLLSNMTLFVKADQLEVEHEGCFTFSTYLTENK